MVSGRTPKRNNFKLKTEAMKKVYQSTMSFEYGSIFINGELYGTEEEFFSDVDAGKIEIINDTPEPWRPDDLEP